MNCPALCLSAHPLRVDTVPHSVHGHSWAAGSNLMDCRPSWGAGLLLKARNGVGWQDSPLGEQPSLGMYLGLQPTRGPVVLAQPGSEGTPQEA